MVKQYPHVLTIAASGTESTQDADGNWITTTPATTVDIPCRYETAGQRRTFNNIDGKTLEFKGTVYMPFSAPDVSANQNVTVKDHAGNTVIDGKVIEFYRGQLNCCFYL